MNEQGYPMLAAAVESVGVWRQLERFASTRFGHDSPEHNMVREQLATNLGADLGVEEDKAIEHGGDVAQELSRRLRAEHDVPTEEAWEEFWPATEARRYRMLVTKAQRRTSFRLRRRMRKHWTRLMCAAQAELGDDFRDLRAPDWLMN